METEKLKSKKETDKLRSIGNSSGNQWSRSWRRKGRLWWEGFAEKKEGFLGFVCTFPLQTYFFMSHYVDLQPIWCQSQFNHLAVANRIKLNCIFFGESPITSLYRSLLRPSSPSHGCGSWHMSLLRPTMLLKFDDARDMTSLVCVHVTALASAGATHSPAQ